MRSGRMRPRAPRAGFTIIELLVATIVLSVGVLGLAGTAAVVARQTNGGARMARAAAIAQSRFERLGSMANCAAVAAGGPTGSATTNAIREDWSVAIGAGGTANATVSVTIPPRPNPVVFRSTLRCQ